MQLRTVLIAMVVATAASPTTAQDDLAVQRTDVLAPSGTLVDPVGDFRIEVDIDALGGERLEGGGFTILLEPPRPSGDALFANSFEIQ